MKSGLSVMKHILVLFINNPGKQFTTDNLLNTPILKRRYVTRCNINKSLERLHGLKLIDKINLGSRNVAYKLRDMDKSRQYVAGTLEHLTPHPPAPIRATTKRHRVTYLLQLSKSEIEDAERVGTTHKRNGSNDFYRVKTSNFNITVYVPSGKSQVFIYNESEWEGEFRQIFGDELTYALNEQVTHKMGNSGLAHPITTMGDKIYVDDCLVRIGRSQLPLEVDVHGPEQKVEGDIVPALWEDMRFRGLVINALAEGKLQNEVYASAINEIAIGQEGFNKGLTELKQLLANQPSKNDLVDLREALLKVAKALEPLTKEPEYPTISPTRKDFDPSYQ